MDQDTDYIAYQLSRPEAEKSTVLKDEVDYIAYQLKDEVDSVVVYFNEIYGPGSTVGYHGDCLLRPHASSNPCQLRQSY